jgi:hypothetical protein
LALICLTFGTGAASFQTRFNPHLGWAAPLVHSPVHPPVNPPSAETLSTANSPVDGAGKNATTSHPGGVNRDELLNWIGYPESIPDPNFQNTCAIRLSLALLGSGYPNPGTWPIKAGKFKGRAIETRQRKLSNWLVRQAGTPEKFKSGRDAEKQIGSRRGIISFFSIYGDDNRQDHIAIVAK